MYIQVDWLQINCVGRLNPDIMQHLQLQPYGTRVFKSIYILEENGQEICTIACNPASNIIDPYTHLIKFHNKILYVDGYVSEVTRLINWLGLEFKGFSRLDLCIDFNTFKHNLHPINLISKFLNDKYLHVGRSGFKVQGKIPHGVKFQYLRFGKADAEVSVYLYNKTDELNEAKDKPWIREVWNQRTDLNKDEVWRLEFSVKGYRLNHIDNNTGEVDKLKIESLADQNFLFKYFNSLINKYFTFKYNNNTTNITKMKKVMLFDESPEMFKLIELNDKKESDRSIKILIKSIEKFNSTIRKIKANKGDETGQFYIGDQLLNSVITLYDKQQFYDRKVKGIFDTN